MNRTAGFHLMYLGAFTALDIQNVAAARMLAEVTETEAEVVHAIIIMREAATDDRVWPALTWLREQRPGMRLRHELVENGGRR